MNALLLPHQYDFYANNMRRFDISSNTISKYLGADPAPSSFWMLDGSVVRGDMNGPIESATIL
jgi:hypothetical protein